MSIKNLMDKNSAMKLVKKSKKRNSATKIPDLDWIGNGIIPPQREYRIYPPSIRSGRKKLVPWRIDFCWPTVKLALEIEGGIFSKGRHTRPSGYIGDMEKYNYISGVLGWAILRYAPSKVNYKEVREVINQRSKLCSTDPNLVLPAHFLELIPTKEIQSLK